MMCELGCVSHYGCRIRLKGIQVSPAATPSRRRFKPRKPVGPSWEKGRAGEVRPDGSWMPYLSPKTGRPMGVKEYADGRGHFDTQVSRLKSDPHVFARERAS
jgi:hypothetical protein